MGFPGKDRLTIILATAMTCISPSLYVIKSLGNLMDMLGCAWPPAHTYALSHTSLLGARCQAQWSTQHRAGARQQ